MENIRQAVERARSRQGSGFEPRQQQRHFGDSPELREPIREVELNAAYLQSQRIVAFDGNDPNSRSFDILRTEVLRSMDLMGWRTLAVTSPTPDCGKTLTAINLALSIARQPERRVLLADLDFRRPRVASCLGLKSNEGTVGAIEGRIELDGAIVSARVGNSRLDTLPTVAASNSSDLVSSSAMKMFLEEINRRSQSQIVVLDLPPLLTGHDAISILPQADCVLMVAAVGTTKASDIREANKYLSESRIVRFVLNKVPQSMATYAYY